MASSNAVIRGKLQARYSAFSSISDSVIDAFLDDARDEVPLSKITSTNRQDKALYLKAASMMVNGGVVVDDGRIKRDTVDNATTVYAIADAEPGMNSFETEYRNLVRAFSRNSPMVLGYNG